MPKYLFECQDCSDTLGGRKCGARASHIICTKEPAMTLACPKHEAYWSNDKRVIYKVALADVLKPVNEWVRRGPFTR